MCMSVKTGEDYKNGNIEGKLQVFFFFNVGTRSRYPATGSDPGGIITNSALFGSRTCDQEDTCPLFNQLNQPLRATTS